MSGRREASARPVLAVAALLAAAVASGCLGGWRREYPADWPPRVPVPDGRCPDVSGVWQNVPAEDPFAFGDSVRLLDALLGEVRLAVADDQAYELGRAVAARAAVATVRLAQPAPDVLELEIADVGLQEPPRPLRRGHDFECEGGVLTIHHRTTLGNANACAAWEWRSAELVRSAAGDLVARTPATVLCVGLLNVLVWSSDWARYGAAEPDGDRPAAVHAGAR